MTQNINPLRAWFRQPAIYMRLPSNGEYWPNDAITIPQNGELPVLPMTALDEISYRTPDALFNGQAVVDVIQSCIPAIANAWVTPSMDINSILVSIRIASYGHEMELTSKCPDCNEESDYSMDMRRILDNMPRTDYTKTIKNGEIEILFKPITFQQQTQISLNQYETQRLIAAAQSDALPEQEKIKAMTEVMKKISLVTTRALSYSITGIRIPGTFVTESEHIEEFLTNCDRKLYETIKSHVVELRAENDIKPIDITCSNCQHRYTQTIELNMSNFFSTAS